jgi:hypothetical protein
MVVILQTLVQSLFTIDGSLISLVVNSQLLCVLRGLSGAFVQLEVFIGTTYVDIDYSMRF